MLGMNDVPGSPLTMKVGFEYPSALSKKIFFLNTDRCAYTRVPEETIQQRDLSSASTNEFRFIAGQVCFAKTHLDAA